MNKINAEHLGGGTVLFKNVLDVPKTELIEHLSEIKENWRKENFKIVYDKDGNPLHAINKGDFIYDIESMNSAPVRIQSLTHPFFRECDDAVYQCLLEYIELFPAVLQCLWWRSTGHVLCYDEGASLGLHCDNDVNYRYGAIPKTEHATRNVVSALVYINDSTDDESVDYSFSGGHMSIPYFGLDITPTSGDILLMPAGYLGAHEIHKVTRGTRYSYLSWFAQGSEDKEKGVSPIVPDEYYKNAGQWWLTSIIEDYDKHISAKYEHPTGTNEKLFAFRTREKDHI